LKYRLDTYS